MNEGEYIAGVWSGHDCSYFIMDHEGQPVVHNELERFNREKEPSGNSIEFMKNNFGTLDRPIVSNWMYDFNKIKKDLDSVRTRPSGTGYGQQQVADFANNQKFIKGKASAKEVQTLNLTSNG